MPIGGTDFSAHTYTYDDTIKDDKNLTGFSLQREDREYKVNYLTPDLRLLEDNRSVVD